MGPQKRRKEVEIKNDIIDHPSRWSVCGIGRNLVRSADDPLSPTSVDTAQRQQQQQTTITRPEQLISASLMISNEMRASPVPAGSQRIYGVHVVGVCRMTIHGQVDPSPRPSKGMGGDASLQPCSAPGSPAFESENRGKRARL
jgi:hypothetical protein